VKSSAGTEAPSEENKFLIETLEFIGKVCDDLVKWLLDRGDGEKEFQILVRELLEKSQKKIDERVLQEEKDREEERIKK
jgi:hypothetical protein